MSELHPQSPMRALSLILAALLAQGSVSLIASGESMAATGQTRALRQNLNDPTRPPASAIRIVESETGGDAAAANGKVAGSAEQSQSALLVLSAVFVSDQGRLAIINGKRVRAGDKIDGMKVRKIGSSHVELTGKRGAITLDLAGIQVKKPSRPLSASRKDPVTK